MKHKTFTIFIGLLVLAWTCQSCKKDDDAPQDLLTISTININPTSNELFFTLDNGETMYPVDMGGITETFSDGQRAFVIFERTDEPVGGYTYSIRVKQIQKIQTKEPVLTEPDKLPEGLLGNDKINVTYLWLTSDKRYLTVEYQIYGDLNGGKEPTLDLLLSPKQEGDSNADYLDLELHYKQSGTPSDNLEEGYVSFRLDNIKEQLNEKKGVRVKVKTIYENYKWIKVKFPEQANRKK